MSEGDHIRVLDPYEATDDSQLTVVEGEIVEFLMGDASGWSLARNVDGKEGWIPGTCYEIVAASLSLQRPSADAHICEGVIPPASVPDFPSTSASTSTSTSTSNSNSASTSLHVQTPPHTPSVPVKSNVPSISGMATLSQQLSSAQQRSAPAAKVEKVEGVTWRGRESFSQSYTCTTKFFGVALEDFAQAEYTRVPTFIWNATNFIETKAIDQEGIYRLSPSMDEASKLVELLNTDPDRAIPEKTNPNVCAQLVKRFLRELPEPLIPVAMYEQFVSAVSVGEEEAKGQAILGCIAQLPECHADLLVVMLKHLSVVAAHQEENKMGLTNLATIFCPCFFRSSSSPMLSLLTGAKEQNELFVWMMNNLSAILAVRPIPPPPISATFTGPSLYAPSPEELVKAAIQHTAQSRDHCIIPFPDPPAEKPNRRRRAS